MIGIGEHSMISIVVYGRYGVAWRLDGAKRREEDLAKAVRRKWREEYLAKMAGASRGSSIRAPPRNTTPTPSATSDSSSLRYYL